PFRKLWNAYRYLCQNAYRWNAYRYLCCRWVNRCVTLMYRNVLRPVWRASSSFAAPAKLLGISQALVRFVIWPRGSGAPAICNDGLFIGEAYATIGRAVRDAVY